MFSRALVLILLVMNLAVALWWWLRPAPVRELPPATMPGVAPLRLLSEVEPGERAPPRPPMAEAQGARRCVEIGPFLTRADLRRAFDVLSPIALGAEVRETEARIDRGFWVYLPAPETRDSALALARELASRGVRDYYVVTAGENENTVSLGLFRERANAEQRLAELRAMGFAPEMGARVETAPNYWIGLALGDGVDWQGRLAGYAGVDVREIDCGG